jgi:hypothetical protein
MGRTRSRDPAPIRRGFADAVVRFVRCAFLDDVAEQARLFGAEGPALEEIRSPLQRASE